MKMFPKCRFCFSGSLDKKLVHGKIVLCDSRSQVSGPFDAGAVGALVQGQGFRDIPLSFPLPGSYLALQDGVSVYDYINSTRYQLKMPLTLTKSVENHIYLPNMDSFSFSFSYRTPIATIFKTDETKDTISPVVASFSSRGPNIVTPEILKVP